MITWLFTICFFGVMITSRLIDWIEEHPKYAESEFHSAVTLASWVFMVTGTWLAIAIVFNIATL